MDFKERIVIYESSSTGGCYEYAKALYSFYLNDERIKDIEFLVPSSQHTKKQKKGRIKPVLINDQLYRNTSSFFQRLYFLYRHFVNPFILFFFLFRKKASLVILNDFEQLSAFLWVPFYKVFLQRHRFTIILHDPDRDNYPPSIRFSEWSMSAIMSLMDTALYHQSLPDKKYYSKSSTNYINVPHGIYPKVACNTFLLQNLEVKKTGFNYVTILGNIRSEKNYEMAIDALNKLHDFQLIIAGSPSASDIDIDKLKLYAEERDVQDRIIWVIKYLSDTEMASVIEISDVILLNYKSTFASQSGIINLIAPYKKKLLVSRTDSGLSQLVSRYQLGHFCEADNIDDFITKLDEVMNENTLNQVHWDQYMEYASWKNHVNIVLKNI